MRKNKSRWCRFTFDRLDLVPPLPGVYALYSDDGIEYVGSSKNMRQRVGRHLRMQKFVGVPGGLRGKYRVYSRYGEWLMVEARLIRRIRPFRNGPGWWKERCAR